MKEGNVPRLHKIYWCRFIKITPTQKQVELYAKKRDILKPVAYSKQSKKLLFTTFDCAKSHLIPSQVMQKIHNDDLIMALASIVGNYD